MEEETGRKDTMGTPDLTETAGAVDSSPAESRSGPTWRGWVLSILVAAILSVAATLLLGGSGAFRSDRAMAAGAGGCGAGSSCCPPADVKK